MSNFNMHTTTTSISINKFKIFQLHPRHGTEWEMNWMNEENVYLTSFSHECTVAKIEVLDSYKLKNKNKLNSNMSSGSVKADEELMHTAH